MKVEVLLEDEMSLEATINDVITLIGGERQKGSDGIALSALTRVVGNGMSEEAMEQLLMDHCSELVKEVSDGKVIFKKPGEEDVPDLPPMPEGPPPDDEMGMAPDELPADEEGAEPVEPAEDSGVPRQPEDEVRVQSPKSRVKQMAGEINSLI